MKKKKFLYRTHISGFGCHFVRKFLLHQHNILNNSKKTHRHRLNPLINNITLPTECVMVRKIMWAMNTYQMDPHWNLRLQHHFLYCQFPPFNYLQWIFYSSPVRSFFLVNAFAFISSSLWCVLYNIWYTTWNHHHHHHHLEQRW